MSSYKLDLHVHTRNVSECGKVAAQELVYLYKELGYYGIVITDHFYDGYFNRLIGLSWEAKIDCFMSGYREAFEVGNKIGLQLFLGMEIRFTENPNDYLVYGFDEAFLKKHTELYNLSLREFRELVLNKNILIFQAHPFRRGITPVSPELVDGVEVFNGNASHDSRNELALEFARRNNLKMISGSDFHQKNDLGKGGIIIPEKIETSAKLIEVLKTGSPPIQLLGRE